MATRQEEKTQGPRLALNLKFIDSNRTSYMAWHNSNHDPLTVQALTSKGISVFLLLLFYRYSSVPLYFNALSLLPKLNLSH